MSEVPRVLVLFGSTVLFGAERGNLEALTALRLQGAEILCLTNDAHWSTDVTQALDARKIPYRKVPYFHLSKGMSLSDLAFRTPIKLLVANWRFLRAVRTFKPTHIHTYSQNFVANFFIGLLATNTPIVFRAGDEPTLHNWVSRAIWRFTVRRTTRFVAISEYIKRVIIHHGVPEARVEVIYNKPPERIGAASNEADSLSPKDRTLFQICYVGQIIEEKGVHFLVEAFETLLKEHPHVRLTIVGRVSEWNGDAWARELRNTTQQNSNLRDRVTFKGYIENPYSLMAASDILVVPSIISEGLGNVVVEAKSVGLASVVFPKGGLPELVEHGVDGFICKDPTPNALVLALREYLIQPGLAEEHGAASLRSLAKLNIPQFGRRWLGIYLSASGLLGRVVPQTSRACEEAE